ERPIVEAEGAPRGDPVGGTAERVKERVANELDGHPRAPVEGGLARKDREHERAHAANCPDTPRPPHPDLTPDEVDDTDARAARRPRQAQVELWKVDHDEDTGSTGAVERSAKPSVGTVEQRDPVQRLGPAGGRRGGDVDEQIHACRGHALAAHPEEAAAGRLRPERLAPPRAVEIPRG